MALEQLGQQKRKRPQRRWLVPEAGGRRFEKRPEKRAQMKPLERERVLEHWRQQEPRSIQGLEQRLRRPGQQRKPAPEREREQSCRRVPEPGLRW